MKQLEFHRELYAGEAIDEAIKTFSSFASFEQAETDDYWVVRITPRHPDHARRIVGEFQNYCLGLSLTRGEARGGGAA